MANNWAFIIWIAVTASLCNMCGGKRKELVNGTYEWRTTWFWAIVMLLPVIIGAIYRGGSIGDTGTYESMFHQCPSSFSEAEAYLSDQARDKGYAIWSILFKSIFGDNFRLFLAFNDIFCSAILIYVYRKHSCSYAISIFLFVAGFEYFQWLFNGMRQFLAVCISLSCMDDIIQKRYHRIILPMAIAATLHMSVLVIIPCLFFVQGRAFNRRILLFAVGVIGVGIVLGQTGTLNELIAELMQSTQYDSVLDEFYETMEAGTNYLRVLVYLVPTVIAFMGMRYIRQENDPVINFCTNMSVISSGLYIISMFTSAILIGRLPIYFSIYNYILLPWEIKHMFTERSARIVNVLLIIFYLVYNYYQVVVVYNQPFSFGFLSLG